MTNIILQRYKQLGEVFDPEEVSIHEALRVNTLKISEEELVNRLKKRGIVLEKIPYLPNSYWYQSSFSLSSTTEYLSGYFYLQETASQIPAIVLLDSHTDFSNKKILDMCAAPGSKTTQIGSLTQNKGLIVALDSHDARLDVVKSNLERQGITNAVCIRKEAEFVKDLGMKFDYILLDAPCSGNFCIEKDFFQDRTVYDITSRVTTQKKLFKAAYHVLENNGVLVYSTCSLEPEENELLIDWAIKEFTDLQLQQIDLDIGDKGLTSVFGKEISSDVSKTMRFWPHKTKTEGFFVAKLQKV